MTEKILMSEEENIVVENYETGLKAAATLFEDGSNVGSKLSPLFKKKFSFAKRREVMKGEHWTLDDISNVCLYFCVDDTEIIDEYISEVERQEYLEKAQIFRQSVLRLIRSKVWDDTLTPGKDVILYGKDFGDDPRDSICASSFIKIVDKENKIVGNLSIIRIPDNVREIVEKREKIKEIEEKSDEEILLAYLKSEFMEDIRNGASEKELQDKFIEKGQSDPCKKHKYRKYKIDGREIRISKNRLGSLAYTLKRDKNIAC